MIHLGGQHVYLMLGKSLLLSVHLKVQKTNDHAENAALLPMCHTEIHLVNNTCIHVLSYSSLVQSVDA